MALIASCCSIQVWAQRAPSKKDSIRSVLKTAPEDTAKVETYLLYGEFFETANPDSAVYYYEKARELSEHLHYQKGIATYISYYVFVLLNHGEYEKALALNLQALDIYKALPSTRDIAVVYNNIANCYDDLGNLEFALENYLLADQYFKKTDTTSNRYLYASSVINNNIGGIFIRLGEMEKADHYIRKSYAQARRLNDDRRIGSSLVNLSICEQKLGNYALALSYCDTIEAKSKVLNDYPFLLDAKNNRGDVFLALRNYDAAAQQYQQIIQLAKENEDPNYELAGLLGLTKLYNEVNRLQDAETVVILAIDKATQFGLKETLMQSFLLASEIHSKQGQLKNALDFRIKYEALNDTLLGEKAQQNMRILQIQYQTKQRESELDAKNMLLAKNAVEIRQKNIVNRGLLIGSVLLALVGLLFYRNLKNKRQLLKKNEELHVQQIRQMEKERQLIAVQSLMKGQEEERSRMARDLHDGVGGLLSGVKLSLSTMKGSVFLSAENVRAVSSIIGQLDSSITELRRVSHNMMPETLIKYGLKEALENYCEGIDQSGALQVRLQTYGLEQRMEQDTEIILYRIIQELLNNAIKHAEAKQVLVQLIREADKFTLTVEDDGRGFDKKNLPHKKGAGLQNIEARVGYLNGVVDIRTAPGEGTSITIEGTLI